MESWDCRDLFITRNNKEEGRKFGDTLNVGSDGTYTLKVDGNIKGTHYIFLNSTGNKNCAGERRDLKTCTVPYEGAKVHEVLSSRRESEAWAPVLAAAFRPNEPGTITKPPLVGQVWSISFHANGRVSGPMRNVIQNNIELHPSQGGGQENATFVALLSRKLIRMILNQRRRGPIGSSRLIRANTLKKSWRMP
jgi:hypothetical protein